MEVNVQPVLPHAIECLWTSVAETTSDPRSGIFGPSSLSWMVNRESALFLGAGRAALLQLAHPWVAASLHQHSNLRSDPLARFHGTFRVVFTMIFGTLNQALSASRNLYKLHTRIQGNIPETIAAHPQGSHYQANEVNALVWVYATLIESALIAYETVLPPLSADQREAYFAESKTLAALFGIPPSALPANWSDFEAYNRDTLSSGTLGVNDLSRDMAHHVLHGKGSWVPVPAWYRAFTAASLPEQLRTAFALPFGPREQKSAATARYRLPRIYRRLPAAMRFVGPYQEATARLHGLPVGAFTRANNRFWMGQPRMIFADPER